MHFEVVELKRYRCSICGCANDPEVYAMEKINGRWYHTICMERALYYFIRHYAYRLDKHLNFVSCEKREVN